MCTFNSNNNHNKNHNNNNNNDNSNNINHNDGNDNENDNENKNETIAQKCLWAIIIFLIRMGFIKLLYTCLVIFFER